MRVVICFLFFVAASLPQHVSPGSAVHWGTHVTLLTHLHALFAIALFIPTDSCVKCYLRGGRGGRNGRERGRPALASVRLVEGHDSTLEQKETTSKTGHN